MLLGEEYRDRSFISWLLIFAMLICANNDVVFQCLEARQIGIIPFQ